MKDRTLRFTVLGALLFLALAAPAGATKVRWHANLIKPHDGVAVPLFPRSPLESSCSHCSAAMISVGTDTVVVVPYYNDGGTLKWCKANQSCLTLSRGSMLIRPWGEGYLATDPAYSISASSDSSSVPAQWCSVGQIDSLYLVRSGSANARCEVSNK